MQALCRTVVQIAILSLVPVASYAVDTNATRDVTAKSSTRAHRVTKTATGTTHGKASYYARSLAGRKTASGARYDPNAMTAAHRTLPLGTKLKVTNPKTDKSVVVTVNDRGPVPKDRMVDLSNAAAKELGMTKAGTAQVETEVVGKDGGAAK